MLLGRLVMDGPSGPRGSIKALLSASLRRTTLLLWFIWYVPHALASPERCYLHLPFIKSFIYICYRMACAFCYYGLVLMSTELFGGELDLTSPEELRECRPLQTNDYLDLLWTTLAEFPGIFITIYIIEKCGRKKTMAFQFLLYAGCVVLLTATKE